MAQGTDEVDASSAPLIEHLTELRNRIMWSLLAFVIAMCIAFAFAGPIFNFLAAPVQKLLADRGQDEELIYTALQEGFMVYVRISVFGGFMLAFPVIGYQMWRFVAPGLYRNEKSAFMPFLVASPVLFLIGAAFAFYVVVPMAYGFFLNFQQSSAGLAGAIGIKYQGKIDEYLGLTIKFVTAFGLCFQLPVLLTLLGMAEIVSSQGLASTRRYAVVGILILAAVATPPDMMSQLVLFAAIYPLYEVSIQLVRMIEQRREKRLRAEGYYDDVAADVAESDPS